MIMCLVTFSAGSAIQALVQGLETSVLYRFWMQAVTGAGPGLSTDVIRIITPSDKDGPGRSPTVLTPYIPVVCPAEITCKNRAHSVS